MTTKRALVAVIVLICAVAAAAAVPMSAGLMYAGTPPDLSVLDAVVGSARVALEGRWDDPAGAYRRAAREGMPSARGFAMTVSILCVVLGALGWAAVRRLDVTMARPRLARRWFELTGTRPRSWARPRDLRPLFVQGRVPGRLTLGTIGRRRRLLAAEPETHTAIVAPTGSGKSTRFIIPWILEADDGPLVVCSTKLDVVEATIAHRARLGDVFVWDPFGPRTSGWTPLAGCRTWSGALRRAKWIVGTNPDAGDHEAARFWNGVAAKLIAPLLHAAALDGNGMVDVLAWLDDAASCTDVVAVLDGHGAAFAARQLQSMVDLDERNKGTTFMSAGQLLEAYRFPEVQECDRPEITPERVLSGRSTLYVVASEDDQAMLAPLVVGMVAELLSYAQREARLDRELSRLFRVLLDETANIAPLRDLPKYLSGVRGARVRIVTVWQDLAQLRTRYREAAGTILSNSQVKVFLGPVTDDDTRRYVESVLGDERVETVTETEGDRRSVSTGQTWRPRAGAQTLQQLGAGRALLLHTDLPAAVIDTTPWYADRQLLSRIGAREPLTGRETPTSSIRPDRTPSADQEPRSRRHGASNGGTVSSFFADRKP